MRVSLSIVCAFLSVSPVAFSAGVSGSGCVVAQKGIVQQATLSVSGTAEGIEKTVLPAGYVIKKEIPIHYGLDIDPICKVNVTLHLTDLDVSSNISLTKASIKFVSGDDTMSVLSPYQNNAMLLLTAVTDEPINLTSQPLNYKASFSLATALD
ncbi:hypothetical protein [Thiothrix lacustris]|uniref:hypothetical protein n=1 Tax=Thiothrix lacustris TaxID=525917 RepID=UPI0027E4C3F6|nr:hypothetical protein [Thiothrix lacustris]WMP19239.1 hypothetical protein RCS87_09365 [Thiothrix lacustris]